MMRTVQKLIPDPKRVEVHRIFVNASPDRAWETARHFDGSNIPWINFLFNLRDLPNQLMGSGNIEKDFKLGVDQVTENGKGFMILHEEPGREVVVGSVGQFWHVDIPFAHIAPGEFINFHMPGWGKLVWAITVEPYEEGSTVSLELRISATDEVSWRKLERYYSLIGVGSGLIRKSMMKRIESALGKLIRDYDNATLPGDDLIPDTKYVVTNYIDIEAPSSIIWRYLMQMGCDRAGWYSVDVLDNGGVPSTDFLVEGWSERKVGDRLSATPKLDQYFEVYKVDFERSFVIGGESEPTLDPYKSTWDFLLKPIGNDAATLIVRAKMKSSPAWKAWLLGTLVLPPIHKFMEGAQLRNLKAIAERDACGRTQENTTLINQNL